MVKKPSLGDKPSQSRGSRRGLTREAVLAEARRMIDEEGLDALNMRALAQRLGVSTMALYNHVDDKRDLVNGIARNVIGSFDVPVTPDDWQEQLRATSHILRRICLANPRMIPLIEKANVLGPAAFRPMEAAVASLAKAGMEPREALTAYFLVVNFTLGHSSYELRGPFRGLDPAEALRSGHLEAQTFPFTAQAVSGKEWDFDAAFEFGLWTILEGLEARLSPR